MDTQILQFTHHLCWLYFLLLVCQKTDGECRPCSTCHGLSWHGSKLPLAFHLGAQLCDCYFLSRHVCTARSASKRGMVYYGNTGQHRHLPYPAHKTNKIEHHDHRVFPSLRSDERKTVMGTAQSIRSGRHYQPHLVGD